MRLHLISQNPAALQHRESILDVVRNVPSISIDAFQGSILPQVASPTQLYENFLRLRSNAILQPDERWTVFPVDPIFMAVEVQRKWYISVQEDNDATIISILEAIGVSEPFLARLTIPESPFLHNFYHDAESLWWIGVHSLFTTEFLTDERNTDAADTEGTLQFLIPTSHHGKYSKITKCLPNEFRDVMILLGVIRNTVVAAYKSAEAQKDFPQYGHFAKLFEQGSVLEKPLEKAVALAVNDIRPFQLDEENYTGYDTPEDDADTSGGYIVPNSKGTATKRPIEEVNEAEFE
ncbi:hypothetical protein F5146DRAFT_1218612 [Armillaria mellea]|nr:hypothetical protein F5146DRAFT_1218612 [Armillaria mellea]